MPTLKAYGKHSQTQNHIFNLENKKAMHTVYTQNPVVLISIFEHNANLIPWRETGAEVIIIPMSDNGDLDYDYLQNQLDYYKDWNSLKVSSFASGSNVTGSLFDMDRIAVMCHKAGFLACFDCAATCPYQDINMNGITKHLPFEPVAEEDVKLAYKDSIFISPHKLVGGPGSSGILLAK